MNKFKATVTLFLICAVALFAIQNVAMVEIQFLIWGFAIPRVLLIITLLLIGFILGLLVSSFSTLKIRGENR